MKSELPGGLIRVLERVTRPVHTDEALTLAATIAEPFPHQKMSAPMAVCALCDRSVTLQEDTCIGENGQAVHTNCYANRILQDQDNDALSGNAA